MSNELLDDYEEGTFTPYFSTDDIWPLDAVSAYERRIGIYTRVGNLVTVSIYVTTDENAWGWANGASASDTEALRVGGLPFSIANIVQFFPSATCGYFRDLPNWEAGFMPSGYGVRNTSYLVPVWASSDPDAQGTAIGIAKTITTNFISRLNSQLMFNMTYQTDA